MMNEDNNIGESMYYSTIDVPEETKSESETETKQESTPDLAQSSEQVITTEETPKQGNDEKQINAETSSTVTTISTTTTTTTTSTAVSKESSDTENSSQNVIKSETEDGVYVDVTKPEKVGDGVNAYVTYLVVTKKDGKEVHSVRRYSDFLWLQQQLQEEYSDVLIPPLPEKAIMNRFTPEFVEYRRKELLRFMKRVLNHPVLSKCNSIPVFIKATETELQTIISRTRSVGSKIQETAESGLFGSLISSVTSVVGTPKAEPREVDNWFDTQSEYLTNLEKNLQVVAQKSSGTSKARLDMSVALADVAQSISVVASTELNQNQALSEYWGKLADILRDIVEMSKELSTKETELFEDVLKDNYRQVGSAKDLLANRWAALCRHQNSKADTESKQEKFKKNQGTSKTSSSAAELAEAKDIENELEKKFNDISDKSKEELQKFLGNKSQDVRQALRDVVRHNMNYQLRVVNLWKELLNQMEENK
eukprot:TRINITY_DN5667_c0_g1_i1.p1 TRINITY_DN5667_c0_g1~~TRINITY_DN5667_c0_g1_i1.p1  ORF type:complete len:480 (-),score=122.91 TRINITY_DN5667_c0_g1_i1:7-1446(-)